jgi:hypothetical protein
MATALTAAGVEFPDSSVLGTNPLPSGTRLLFHNSTAPTGWTKDTSINDSALRVVSGTPGSGGSAGFASALGTPSVSGSVGLSGEPGSGNLSTSISGNVNIGSTTLSTNQIPSHSHNAPRGGNTSSFIASPSGDTAPGLGNSTNTGGTGGSGSHNHNAGHNLSGSISGSPDIGTLSGSLSSASASINVKFQDFIIAQKD